MCFLGTFYSQNLCSYFCFLLGSKEVLGLKKMLKTNGTQRMLFSICCFYIYILCIHKCIYIYIYIYIFVDINKYAYIYICIYTNGKPWILQVAVKRVFIQRLLFSFCMLVGYQC